MEKASERLEQLLSYLKITANKLAIDKLGYDSNVKIYHIKNGRNNFSSEIAKDISNKFPEINYNWILTGDGEMLNENKESNKVTINNSLPKLVNNNISVPYYDVDFAGGWDSEEMFSNQMPAFDITSPDFAKAEFACNLVGNSISNRIPNGAIIGLREIFNWQIYFPTNELYGVLTKNDLRTVKIVKRSKKSGYLTLLPDPLPQYNKTEYEPEEIPIEFISKFFQLVAWACFEKVAM